MNRTLTIAAMLLLSACETKTVDASSVAYVSSWQIKAIVFMIGALLLALASGFVLLIWWLVTPPRPRPAEPAIDGRAFGTRPAEPAIDGRAFGTRPAEHAIDGRAFGTRPADDAIDGRAFGMRPADPAIDRRVLGMRPADHAADG
jgi:hypothetical protein